MSLITVNTSLGVWIYIIHRLPFYIQASLKVIPQKGNDADNIVLLHDTSVYVVAAGRSGGGVVLTQQKKRCHIFQTHHTLEEI